LRVAVLTVAILFIALLAFLTVRDFVRYGVTPLGVLSVLVLVLFVIGIVGALRQPPPSE
jgi:hypothetical protein